MPDDVTLILEAVASSDDQPFTDETLRRVWSDLGLDTDEIDYLTFEEAFLTQVENTAGDDLAFKGGGWVVNATSALVKTSITTALLTVALAATGATGISLLVIPAVLPLVVDIQRVRLTKSEQHLLATLTLTDAGRNGTAETLYAALPDSTKAQVNELTFRDFLEKCRQAGLADSQNQTPDDQDTFTMHGPTDAKFRVTFA